MKQQTKQICRLLESDRGDVQCAAALVLGHLGDTETGVVDALGGLLEAGHDRRVKGYVLEALERISDPASLPTVLPLLASEDDLQEKAVRVVAGLGSARLLPHIGRPSPPIEGRRTAFVLRWPARRGLRGWRAGSRR